MLKKFSKINLAGIGFISWGALLYQVCLTRILNVTIGYHFAFLVISLAMLGMAASAIVCFSYWDRFIGDKHKEYMACFCIFFSILAPLAIYIHLNLNFDRVILGSWNFYLILATQLLFFTSVFFSAGMCINIMLSEGQNQIGEIYSFDLLGAALGSFLAVPLMYYTSPLAIVFLISATGLFTAWLFLEKTSLPWTKSSLFILLFLSILLFFENEHWKVFTINTVKNFSQERLQHLEVKGKIFEKWSPLSRTTVFHLISPVKNAVMPFLIVENDASAPTKLLNKNFWTVEYIKKLLPSTQAVYLIKKHGDALIIGSGGGRDVLAALVFGQKSITAVEVNPVTAEIVTKRFADYIGHIFNYPQVKLKVQEGRNFVAGTKRKYDIIQVSMADSWVPTASAYIFNENNLYTKEAIHDYISHLKPDGILSISRFYSFDEALRLTNTIVAYLEEKQIRDIQNRIVVIRIPDWKEIIMKQTPITRIARVTDIHPPPASIATVLLKNGLFNAQEIKIIRDFSFKKEDPIIYAPYLSVSQMEPSRYASLFRFLILSLRQRTRDDFVALYPRDISPSTDDKPFFFFMTRFRNLFDLHAADDLPARFAILLLYVTCFLVFIFVVLMIFLPLYMYRQCALKINPLLIKQLFYFAFIGMGFMLIELSLIQRLTVFLGQPVFALVVVLSTLLLSGAMGSLTSAHLAPLKEGRQLKKILEVITGLGTFIGFVVYDQLIGLMWLNNIHRIFLSVAIIIPLGFMLGMCLPLGIKIIRKWDRRLIIWAWGINGSFSVFGSVLSIILALNFGLKSVFLIGIGCYLASWVIMISGSKPQDRMA